MANVNTSEAFGSLPLIFLSSITVASEESGISEYIPCHSKQAYLESLPNSSYNAISSSFEEVTVPAEAIHPAPDSYLIVRVESSLGTRNIPQAPPVCTVFAFAQLKTMCWAAKSIVRLIPVWLVSCQSDCVENHSSQCSSSILYWTRNVSRSISVAVSKLNTMTWSGHFFRVRACFCAKYFIYLSPSR